MIEKRLRDKLAQLIERSDDCANAARETSRGLADGRAWITEALNAVKLAIADPLQPYRQQIELTATSNVSERVLAIAAILRSWLGDVDAGLFEAQPVDATPQQIAASREKMSEAVRSTVGEVKPPVALRAEGLTARAPSLDKVPAFATFGGAGGMSAAAFVQPQPIPVVPTIYPDTPEGPIVVHNHITINVNSPAFIRFDGNIGSIIRNLSSSNIVVGEARDKIISELTAGMAVIKGPKPSREQIELLLVRPLMWLAEKVAVAAISTLVGDALHYLMPILT